MADGPSTSSSAMNRLNTFGCPPMPAFTLRRRRNLSEEVSDSDSLGNFNPYGTVTVHVSLGETPAKKKRRRRRRRGRLMASCPCCGFQRMEVVPGLWYRLEGLKQAWHWIGNPLQAWSVLAPLTAVPLDAASRPTAPPPLPLLHMAVFPAAVYRRMVRDANRVLCMAVAPPPHSIGAWYSIDDDDDKGDAAALDVTISRSSSCDPWYTAPPGAGSGDDDGRWIWFPVPPPQQHPATAVSLQEEEEEEPLVLGRWMTETLRSAEH